MQAFLQTIAGRYLAHFGSLENFLFIFPGRRAATFFNRYLERQLGSKVMLMPRTTTIANFVEQLSGRVVDNRIDLLITLYAAYLNVHARLMGSSAKRKPRTFDEFRNLGETILSDFNEVDTHLVDAQMIFRNLADLQSIGTDYLTDDQKEVISEYFNSAAVHKDVRRFWAHFEGKQTHNKSKFLTLWHFLWPMYEEFNKLLAAEGLTYPGAAYRQALENLRDCDDRRDLIPEDRVVFVGFNVLTSAEWHIFKEMKKDGYADFVWDISDLMMTQEDNLSASRYIMRAMRAFPKPEWLDLSECRTSGLPPKVTIVSAPSNTAQAKIVGKKLQELHGVEEQSVFDADGVAVVLADEHLLFPMINSIPQTIRSVNLTMGCSLKMSPIASFVGVFRRLQVRGRTDAKYGDSFFHEDVDALLHHPCTHALLGYETVRRAQKAFITHRKFMVSPQVLQIPQEFSDLLFKYLIANSSPIQVLTHLDKLLAALEEHWTPGVPMIQNVAHDEPERVADSENEEEEDDGTALTMDHLGLAQLRHYRLAVSRLIDSFSRLDTAQLKVEPKTVLLLADRLISGERVDFEGEPVGKLQIMGMLETRSLDFKHVIITSMNERIFPRRRRAHTLIPDALRKGFGMPTAISQEALYSYYFYRLISRAQELTLIYDSRTAGVKSGEPSRYIMQLIHLYRPETLLREDYRFDPAQGEAPLIEVRKDETVMKKLLTYTDPESDAYFSASKLKRYCKCPLIFYFDTFTPQTDEPEPQDHLSPLNVGNIVHKVLFQIYAPEGATDHYWDPSNPLKPTEEADVEAMVRRAVNEEYLHNTENPDAELPPEVQLHAELICSNIQQVMELTASDPEARILGLEAELKGEIPLPDGRNMKFTMIMDRVDKTSVDGRTYIRIVDYKTGMPRVTAPDAPGIFSGSGESENLPQVLLYAELLRKYGSFRGRDYRFQPVILTTADPQYVLPKVGCMPSGKVSKNGDLKFEPIVVEDYCTAEYFDEEMATESPEVSEAPRLADIFTEGLTDVLQEILDPETPFRQTSELEHCKWCTYKSFCRRQ